MPRPTRFWRATPRRSTACKKAAPAAGRAPIQGFLLRAGNKLESTAEIIIDMRSVIESNKITQYSGTSLVAVIFSRRDASSGDNGGRRKLCGHRTPCNCRLGDFFCSSQLT